MPIKVTKGNVSFVVENPDPQVEVALGLAVMKRHWGYKGNTQGLTGDFDRIIEIAKSDPRPNPEEISRLEFQRSKLILLEELAESFRERALEAESPKDFPRFQGDLAEARATLSDYSFAVGCELELS